MRCEVGSVRSGGRGEEFEKRDNKRESICGRAVVNVAVGQQRQRGVSRKEREDQTRTLGKEKPNGGEIRPPRRERGSNQPVSGKAINFNCPHEAPKLEGGEKRIVLPEGKGGGHGGKVI